MYRRCPISERNETQEHVPWDWWGLMFAVTSICFAVVAITAFAQHKKISSLQRQLLAPEVKVLLDSEGECVNGLYVNGVMWTDLLDKAVVEEQRRMAAEGH